MSKDVRDQITSNLELFERLNGRGNINAANAVMADIIRSLLDLLPGNSIDLDLERSVYTPFPAQEIVTSEIDVPQVEASVVSGATLLVPPVDLSEEPQAEEPQDTTVESEAEDEVSSDDALNADDSDELATSSDTTELLNEENTTEATSEVAPVEDEPTAKPKAKKSPKKTNDSE